MIGSSGSGSTPDGHSNLYSPISVPDCTLGYGP
jgi:hypothetical protein